MTTTASRYAYSYNREDYTGAHDTPERAFEEAVRNAETMTNPPTEVYVGRVVTADPQATHHADMGPNQACDSSLRLQVCLQ